MPYHFSDVTDDQLLFERVESFGGGVDGFIRSTLLPADTSQFMQNMVVLDNLEARTRPGADKLGDAAVNTGKVQALAYFDTRSAERLIAAVKGHIYRWNGTNWTEIDPAVTLSDASASIDIAQGVDTALITNINGTMLVLNAAATTLTPLGSVTPPTGATILCWHAGRMFASGFPGSGGSGLEDDAICASALLDFSGATAWDLINRSFRVGSGDGDPIKALASLQDFNLAVLKENSVWLCRTDPTAVPGNYSADQASEALGFGVGCVGRKAWAVYGNDLLFMSRDGVYSLRRMQAATGQYELSAPLSQPIQPYIDRINWSYASGITATRYKQYVLFSVPLDSSTTNDTVLVFNGRLSRWVGIWTGWAPSHWAITRFSGNHRLTFGTATGYVRQWKDNDDVAADETYLDDGAAIASALHTKAFLFGEPVNDKDLYHGEWRFSAGNAHILITLVADGADLKSFTIDATKEPPRLPIQLPFNLVSPGNTTLKRGLRNLTAFNEVYCKITSSEGWWSLRNLTLSAFLNMLQNE